MVGCESTVPVLEESPVVTPPSANEAVPPMPYVAVEETVPVSIGAITPLSNPKICPESSCAAI